MNLLIPGRHHLLTQFQFSYIQNLVNAGLKGQKDVHGKEIESVDKIDAIIFAVTSANHSNTRRNPLAFYLRAIAIEAFGNELNVPVYVYGIDDVGDLPNFAAYTIKRIRHDSDMLFNCNPENTMVICSTPVLKMYQDLGFTILPAELYEMSSWKHHTSMPWDIVARIAGLSENWHQDSQVNKEMHNSSRSIWMKYRLGEKVQLLFRDDMISSDGDLTETRDYNVYVRQMDEIAELKYRDTAEFIKAGRIGDIGCAVGSWLKIACNDARFRESDMYGIEVSQDICMKSADNEKIMVNFKIRLFSSLRKMQ